MHMYINIIVLYSLQKFDIKTYLSQNGSRALYHGSTEVSVILVINFGPLHLQLAFYIPMIVLSFMEIPNRSTMLLKQAAFTLLPNTDSS